MLAQSYKTLSNRTVAFLQNLTASKFLNFLLNHTTHISHQSNIYLLTGQGALHIPGRISVFLCETKSYA